MTDEQVIHVPHSGSGAFHPTHVDTPAGRTARKPHATSGNGVQKLSDNIQVVEFLLGDEHFAIDLFEVREGVYTRITHLPDIPPRISRVSSI